MLNRASPAGTTKFAVRNAKMGERADASIAIVKSEREGLNMKRKFISTIVGFSVVLLSLFGAPAFAVAVVTEAGAMQVSAAEDARASAAGATQV